MKGWLLANLFLIGMAIIAAAILGIGTIAIRIFQLSMQHQNTLTGCLSILALIATGLIARAAIRRIERRR